MTNPPGSLPQPGSPPSARAAFAMAALLLILPLMGCAPATQPAADQPVDFIVHGAGGDGPAYDALARGLHNGGVQATFQRPHWGAPAPFFMMNLQDDAIHRKAEAALATDVRTRLSSSTQPVEMIGHSAGCGVVLGALGQLPPGQQVHCVILLAPSVSPGYDLTAAMAHVSGTLHVFYSNRDTLWLQWRTGHFGSYDNIKTPAAGFSGFTSIDALPPATRARVVQHPCDPAWSDWGNDGGHFGALAPDFAQRVLAPLLTTP